jgi:hypothetical protein
MLPLYEAKMIHHYDTRWATYEPDGSTRLMTPDEKTAHVPPMPRYWVRESDVDKKLDGKWNESWFLGWRRICRSTDERTVIASLVPRVGVGDSIFLALPSGNALRRRSMLAASLSSLVLDYVARQKVGGTNLSFFIMDQLPVPRPDSELTGRVFLKPVASWVETAVERLNSQSLAPGERLGLRCELDALLLLVYGVQRDEADYILETFPIVKAKDIKEFGEYRTKRLILAAYDAMAEAINAGEYYRSPFEREGSV